VFVFQEPSLLSSLQDNGLTDVMLHALLIKDVSPFYCFRDFVPCILLPWDIHVPMLEKQSYCMKILFLWYDFYIYLHPGCQNLFCFGVCPGQIFLKWILSRLKLLFSCLLAHFVFALGSCYTWSPWLSPKCIQCTLFECPRSSVFCTMSAIWTSVQSSSVSRLPPSHA
jgi:hypothetical protein